MSSMLGVPAFHEPEILALLCFGVGLTLAFLGYRVSRLFCFILGFVLGFNWVDDVFWSEVAIRHAGLPLIIISLVSLVVAVTALLLHSFTLSVVLGYVISLWVLSFDQGRLFGWGEGRTLCLALSILTVLYLSHKSGTLAMIASTSCLGSFLTILAIDHFAGKSLTSLLFTGTEYRTLVGAQDAAPECTIACFVLSFVWIGLTALSGYIQLVLYQLRESQLVAERRRLADDPLFNTTSFSYSTFSKAASQQRETLSVTDRAAFNFFDPQRLPENLQPLYPRLTESFESLVSQFGFQASSAVNQTEHLMFLLGNYKSRDMPDAVTQLHAKLLSNYIEWTQYLKIQAYCQHAPSTSNLQTPFSPVHSSNASSALKLQEIALWLCIWGEAGNLRHTPECLCYIYHNLAAELSVFRDSRGRPKMGRTAPARPADSFLSDVITPIFNLYRNEKATDLETTYRHYDDWNEFFWTRHCLSFYVGLHKYYVEPFDSNESGRQSNSSSASLLNKNVTIPIPVADALRDHRKTHLERRSWLHPARAFMRIIVFFFTVFHILVCLAYCNYRRWPLLGPDANRVLSSFVISLIGWSIVGELIEVWAQYGIISSSPTKVAGFLLRLAIKTVSFFYLVCFYMWSYAWGDVYYHAYCLTAIVCLIPYAIQILAQIFPSFSLAVRKPQALQTFPYNIISNVSRFWYPATSLYVGRDVQEPVELTHKYQLFWVCLLVMKFYLSYQFQVMPLIDPTWNILTSKKKWTHIPLYNQVAESTSIFVLWIPFVLVYMFDPVIYYFLFQAFVGVWVGMRDRLGEIRDFSAFIQSFTSLPHEFEKKLLAWRSKELPNDSHSVQVTASELSLSPTTSGVTEENRSILSPHYANMPDQSLSAYLDEADEFRTAAWRNFAVAWNEVIEDLRQADLISNNEKTMLRFRHIEGSRRELYIPLLVTAGSYDNTVEKILDLAHSYNEASTDSGKLTHTQHLTHYLQNPVRREGILEVDEAAQWLISQLLGEKHESDVLAIYDAFDNIVRTQSILAVVEPEKLKSLKPALLNLVRCLRIAQASFNTYRENEKKKRAKKEEELKANIRAHSSSHKDEKEFMPSDISDISDDESSPSTTPRSNAASVGQSTRMNMQVLMKSPSVGTLNILDTIRSTPRYQSASVVIDADDEERSLVINHLNLIRDQLQALLNAIASCIKPGSVDGRIVHERIKSILVDHRGFQWDDSYAGKCVLSVLRQSQTSTICTTLHAHLTVAQIDAEPSNSEATRRLLFFANSLFMHIPSAPSIAEMKSWSTLTPFHSEDVLYSFADLEKQTDDGVSVFFYLQTIFPNEWANFLERCGISDDRVASILHSKKTLEARLWATTRGQTLGRTIDGMMLYEKALRLLCKLEEPTMYDAEIDELVKQKFNYTVSAQVYGKQKRDGDPKATEIDFYLRKYPSMRVAYIDTVKSPRHDANGKQIVVDEFYSVLIKADQSTRTSPRNSQSAEIREVYRVKLPGNPIIGEGKPENQNQAIIFTRGEYLQTIDMNQSNSFEEALKMRNLLEEFRPFSSDTDSVSHAIDPADTKQPGIVGFREHIYTGGLSSIANYMALQEGTFTSQGQRVLDRPLRVRFHYGHPDVFDKLFFMTRGGVSKASKSIHLSEDIFAGFNCILRGSSVVFREYISVGKGRDVGLQQLFKFEAKLAQGNAMQSLSRDVYRLGHSLDFFRLLSFYFSGVGFYISNSLTIWALYFFLYSRLLLAAFGVQKQDTFSGAETASYWFGLAGFLLTLPVFASLGLERGFLKSAYETGRMLVTGGPLFYMFHMGTKAYYFEQTMLAGGAKYRPTGRGFVTAHEDFPSIYRFHAASHFYRATEMLLLLSFYALVIPWGFSYSLVTWPAWLIVVSWFFAPIWFNPLAFQWEKFLDDVEAFRAWMWRKEGDGERSWKAWWKEEIGYLSELNRERKLMVCLTSTRHAIVGYALLHYVGASMNEIFAGALLLCATAVFAIMLQAKFSHRNQFIVRLIKAVVLFAILVVAYHFHHVNVLTWHQSGNALLILVALMYFLSTFTSILLTCGVRHRSLVKYFKLVDWVVASALMCVIGVLSLTVIPSIIQTRLMFHNAFSRGVMIDKLLRRQQEPKDAPPNTAPTQSDNQTLGFASMNFVERTGKSASKSSKSSPPGPPTHDQHGNGHNNGRSDATGHISALPAAGSIAGRVPSFSSLTKLAEEDEDTTPRSGQPSLRPTVNHPSSYSSNNQSLHAKHPSSIPIPPTVAIGGQGAIPPTISAASLSPAPTNRKHKK